MSRTDRREPFRYFSHEGHFARLLTRRRERNLAKQLLRSGSHDQADTRLTKGTEGWITH